MLLLVGLGFKIAAVPFHMWTPDVYEGAPTPITAFMASATKAAGFAALLRVFLVAFPLYRDDWRPIVWALAMLTLVVGSVGAAVQTDVKRMLAYSSISHAGYVLIGLEAGTAQGVEAALFYLFVYTFMVVGSFAVVTVLSVQGDDDHSIDDYRGLATRQPVLAACSRSSCSRRPASRPPAGSSPSWRSSRRRVTRVSTRSWRSVPSPPWSARTRTCGSRSPSRARTPKTLSRQP